MNRNENQRTVVKIHQQLHHYLKPIIKQSLDTDGAIDLLMDNFGSLAVKERDNLHTMLKNGFSEIVTHRTLQPEVLIDVLTLMDTTDTYNPRRNIATKQFVMALKVLNASGYCEGRDTAKGEMIRSLIWKRLFVRDDWADIHNTNGKSDKDVEAKIKTTALYLTLKSGRYEG